MDTTSRVECVEAIPRLVRATRAICEPISRSKDVGMIMSDVSASQMHGKMVSASKWNENRCNVGWIVSDAAIQGKKSNTPETLVPSVVRGRTNPVSGHRANIITAVEVGSNGASDGGSQKRPPDTGTDGGNEVRRIAIKVKARVLFIKALDIILAKSEENYIALIHKSGCHLVRETMATAEEKLSPLGFVRIHRSILVNASLVKDLRRDNTGTYLLRTIDGSEHPVGRAYKHNLKLIARSWLGFNIL